MSAWARDQILKPAWRASSRLMKPNSSRTSGFFRPEVAVGDEGEAEDGGVNLEETAHLALARDGGGDVFGDVLGEVAPAHGSGGFGGIFLFLGHGFLINSMISIVESKVFIYYTQVNYCKTK